MQCPSAYDRHRNNIPLCNPDMVTAEKNRNLFTRNGRKKTYKRDERRETNTLKQITNAYIGRDNQGAGDNNPSSRQDGNATRSCTPEEMREALETK